MDAALVIYVGTPYLKSMPCAEGIVKACRESGKPVAAMMQVGTDIEESIKYLRENSVPCYELGENAMAVFSKMASYYEKNKCRDTSGSCFYEVKQCGSLFAAGKDRLLEPEAMAVLQENHIPVPPHAFVATKEEAMSSAEKIGFPLVMKIVSPQIVHKSDCGGVILPINTAEEAGEAFEKLEAIGKGKDFKGALMVPMLKGGREVIFGLTRDPQFGPVVAFGMGGIYTEVLKDISLRVAPIDKETAMEMIHELKTYPILAGVRGQKSVDMDALADALVEFSKLPFKWTDLKEADLNPVFLYEDSLCAIDARILG